MGWSLEVDKEAIPSGSCTQILSGENKALIQNVQKEILKILKSVLFFINAVTNPKPHQQILWQGG